MDSLLPFDSDLSQRLSQTLSEMAFPDPNNNEGSNASTKGDKYSLRPRSMRRATEMQKTSDESDRTKPSRPSKPKQKPAPLSKYRRKTANARERSRMREINQAFETLRRAVPLHQISTPQTGANEKLTKITTLRLAMKYISTLSAALNSSESCPFSTSPAYSDLDCLLLESDGESLPLSDHSLLASPDFPEASLSPVDFGDASLLSSDFGEHDLEPSDFSEFLLV